MSLGRKKQKTKKKKQRQHGGRKTLKKHNRTKNRRHFQIGGSIKPIMGNLLYILEKDNIEARRIWKPMHEQPVMSKYQKYINGNSSLLFLQGICLPSGSDLTKKDMKRIIKSIKTFFDK